MDRIDRLLMRAKPRIQPWQRLKQDNPYSKLYHDELLEYLDGENYRAPEMGTTEWNKFIYALVFQNKGK